MTQRDLSLAHTPGVAVLIGRLRSSFRRRIDTQGRGTLVAMPAVGQADCVTGILECVHEVFRAYFALTENVLECADNQRCIGTVRAVSLRHADM